MEHENRENMIRNKNNLIPYVITLGKANKPISHNLKAINFQLRGMGLLGNPKSAIRQASIAF
jgi:hypothetical protein